MHSRVDFINTSLVISVLQNTPGLLFFTVIHGAGGGM